MLHITPQKICCLILLLVGSTGLLAQQSLVRGTLSDSLGNPIEGVNVKVLPINKVTVSDSKGYYQISLDKGDYNIEFTHVRYSGVTRAMRVPASNQIEINLQMKLNTRVLEEVRVRDEQQRREVDGVINIDAKNLENLPSGTGEFTRILATLPGVTSNNELSASYSVRGGNFDENLVYVNGIQVYRPFLVRAGQQEGLSFINSNLVRRIEFSAGGWQARYGDKLSSVLNIDYKEPLKNSGSLTLGLLGGSVHYEGLNAKGDVSYIAGIRHKNTRYLLGTLETQGQYLPKFTDAQAFVTKRFSNNRTKLGVLLAVAQNRYLTIPENRQTDFGTFQQSFRLNVAFQGRELLNYDTYQVGTTLSHIFGDNYRAHLNVSGVLTDERENFEVEGGYRLCDLNNNPASNNFNECAVVRGIGTNYNFGRNSLEASIFNVEQRNEVYLGDDVLEFGFRWDREQISDELKEFAFIDSADFSSITETRNNSIDLNSNRFSGFVQYSLALNDSVHTLILGTRLNYWSLNEQLLVSPRIQYLLSPKTWPKTNFRFAAGYYQQPPFYRELRDRAGNVNKDVKAQSSIHFIAAMDHYFTAWGRPFKFTSEAYFKRLSNVNPYDVDNVRIRYFANNGSTAHAEGVDFRVNGEFIKGAESWFSLGILNTREDIEGDNIGEVRRPTDQRINLGIFFQDHFTNDPTMRVNLSFLFGSGLPFGPPGNDQLRNSFSGDEYYRMDIGFSKIFELKSGGKLSPNSIWVGVEILNLLGADNTISYTWIKDVLNNQFAIPNSLSARFLNAKLVAKF